jgi:hypothetical protein
MVLTQELGSAVRPYVFRYAFDSPTASPCAAYLGFFLFFSSSRKASHDRGEIPFTLASLTRQNRQGWGRRTSWEGDDGYITNWCNRGEDFA